MRGSLLIFLVTLTFYSSAQIPLSYSIKHYTDANGLPQNSIKSIAKDDVGYVWLATENGLSRFDGSNFMHFDKAYSNTRSNRVFSFRRDLTTQNLYAQYEYHELISISRGHISSSPTPFSSLYPGVNPQFMTQEFPLLNPEYGKLHIKLDSISYYQVTSDSIYFHNTTLAPIRTSKLKEEFNFFVSDSQFFQYNSNQGLTLFKNGKPKSVVIKGDLKTPEGRQPEIIKIYWNGATDQTFFLVNESLYLVKYENGYLNTEFLIKGFDFDQQKIRTIYYDTTARQLFMGSLTNGLFVLQLHQFNPKKSTSGLKNSFKYALHPYGDNAVLFADGDLIDKNGKVTRFPLLPSYSTNFAMAIDDLQNIWVVKNTSVYKLSPKGDKLLQYFDLKEETSCLYIDNQNSLWIGTFDGIYALDLNKHNVLPVRVLKADRVSVLRKQGNSLWIGTHGGLFKYNLEEKKLQRLPKMNKMHIRDIYIPESHSTNNETESPKIGNAFNRNNQVWICTYGDGVYLYANKQLTKMPIDKRGYLNTAHCILEDKNGFFWISTNKGLFQVARNDLYDYSTGKIAKVYYQYYNESYGFNSNEFNGGCQPCGAKLTNGTFIYPSLVGSVLFNPTKFKVNLPDKPIYIDRIFRDNEHIRLADTIHIDQNLSRLNIWVSSPYFGDPDNMSLEYKLASNDNWASLDRTSMITFSTLSAGKHELLIRKQSGFGDNTIVKKLSIIVEPYFYQTWWFSGLLILYVIGLIAFFFKRRTQMILKKNERLEHLVNKRTEDLEKYIVDLEESQYLLNQQTTFQKKLLGAITHDLKSPLKYMMIMGKKLYQNEATNSVVKDHLRTIYVSANSMFHFTENLLNYSKLFLTEKTSKDDYISLNRLVSEKISIFAEIARYNGTLIHNNIPDTITIYTNRVMLTVIIHNILDNAIKFCPNGQVTFDAKSTEKHINFWIQDTGFGMPSSILSWLNGEKDKDIIDGLGLKMVKEFASKMNLQLEVNSNTKEGTMIKFSLTQAD